MSKCEIVWKVLFALVSVFWRSCLLWSFLYIFSCLFLYLWLLVTPYLDKLLDSTEIKKIILSHNEP